MNQPAYLLHRGDALAAYERWPTPVVIVSDGAYGVRGFHGDTTGVGGLLDSVPAACGGMEPVCDVGDHLGSGTPKWAGRRSTRCW